MIGFTDSFGSGLGALSVTIYRESVSVYEQDFGDLAAAALALDDLALNLGDWSDGLAGDLDLAVWVTIMSDDPSAAFATTLLIGSSPVPEPALGGLLLLACLAARLRIARQRPAWTPS